MSEEQNFLSKWITEGKNRVEILEERIKTLKLDRDSIENEIDEKQTELNQLKSIIEMQSKTFKPVKKRGKKKRIIVIPAITEFLVSKNGELVSEEDIVDHILSEVEGSKADNIRRGLKKLVAKGKIKEHRDSDLENVVIYQYPVE